MLLAAHLSSETTFMAYILDRILPSLISGLIVMLAGWYMTRTFKSHVEATTISQTEEFKKDTAAQTQVIEQLTAQQTAELKSRRRSN